jgi:hypothetical protein
LHNRNIEEIGVMALPVRDSYIETMEEIVGRIGELVDCVVLSELLLVEPGEGTGVRLEIRHVPGGLHLPSKIIEQHVGLAKLRAAEGDDKGTRANALGYQLQYVILTLQRAPDSASRNPMRRLKRCV